MQTRTSKFVKFQQLKVQELSEEVPIGHIPRSITVHARGENTRLASPGNVVQISGVFLPTPYTGFKAMRAGLIADTYVEAVDIKQLKKSYSDIDINDETMAKIEELADESDVLQRLSQSIAPEIYGMEDAKKALLLLLVGGVTRQLSDGMRIRGDVHICLMGDPGGAKSQLLKHIAKVAPRGVYTTGKGSSGVGLTAAVLRDPVTNDLVLEGGALVLADMGICCIDEFDKMQDADRTAIHEVMEQQTVSIAKAGITTTLNARAAVLAAANPAFGRYNTNLTPAQNINLPPALLSRFDLLFLLLDRPNKDDDERLAQHITHVHRHSAHPPLTVEPLDAPMLKSYIAAARRVEPYVPKELTQHITQSYVRLRKEEVDAKENAHGYTTARTLLSILRLSQALARLRFNDEVSEADVDEAIRLMEASKYSLLEVDAKKMSDRDAVSSIFEIIRNMIMSRNTSQLRRSEVEARVFAKQFSPEQLKQTIDEYVGINVFQELTNGDIAMVSQ